MLLQESIRQGLPHITSMTHDQFKGLMSKPHIDVSHMTEKTDGMTHRMGHDEHGFYTQSSGSGSEKMRSGHDFIERATRRSKETGKPLDLTGAKAFAHVHETLQKNQHLQSYLKSKAKEHGGEASIRGEIFYRPNAKPSESHPGEVKFVGTSYNPSHMGSVGKYVLHSKLPENKLHKPSEITKLGDAHINFDTDKMAKPVHHHVDVSAEHEAFKHLNHTLLASRTTSSNKVAKTAEQEKMNHLQKSVSAKVDSHIQSLGYKPKWGSGSEGVVVHPGHAEAPRFKVTSDAFRSFKASDESKNFKKRLNEGGNVKIGGYAAEPLKAENRATLRKDIHSAMGALGKSFASEHGHGLFGENNSAHKSGEIYAGSTRHFMNGKLSDKEFSQHKSHMGDVDVQIPHEHAEKLLNHLNTHKKFGNFNVLGVKKHGNETTALMQHKSGSIHQFDFEHVGYGKHAPEEHEKFLHSSSWEDTTHGIKGAHHKMLINAAGGEHHKFSITGGLKSRTDEKDPGIKSPQAITHKLFGPKADTSKIHSFVGVTQLIKKHIPKQFHQAIHDKFAEKATDEAGKKALAHLSHHLGLTKHLSESDEVHHTAVIPLTGFSPISHMGHAKDLGAAMSKLPGTSKHIGMSSKADLFKPEEREHIFKKQLAAEGHSNIKTHTVSGAGETIRRAHDEIASKPGKKVLHLLVGHDRAKFAEGLKKSLEAGKIKEMEGHKFDEIHIHHPEGEERAHGMSGTKMRAAASEGNRGEFFRHLGPAFKEGSKNGEKIFKKMKGAIDSGALKVKR